MENICQLDSLKCWLEICDESTVYENPFKVVCRVEIGRESVKFTG
jgi:hypothetical protein